MAFLTLDRKGLGASLIMAGALLLLGGAFVGIFFVLLMIYFLALSAIVTWMGMSRKKTLHLYQYDRSIGNVIANGGCPLIVALIFFVLNNYSGVGEFAFLAVIAFIGSVAAITADKFSSEMGVLDGMPRLIFTLRKVRRGVSGGVTSMGLLAGLFGSFLISLSAFGFVGASQLLFTQPPGSNFSIIAILSSIIVAGFVGTIVDSMLGYYEEKGFGNKFTSNFICSISGALVSVAVLLVLSPAL